MTVNAILVSAVDRIRAASMNAQRIVAENSAVMILNATLENAVMNFQESAPRISHSVVDSAQMIQDATLENAVMKVLNSALRISHSVVDSAQMIQDAIRVQVNVVEIISV
jgi:hypothetical protein